MAKDDRLELGRYLTNPFNEGGRAVRQLNFNDLFASKPATGSDPVVSRERPTLAGCIFSHCAHARLENSSF